MTVDIPGAFLQGDWPGEEHPGHIKFTGIMVELLCEIDPSLKEQLQNKLDRVHLQALGQLEEDEMVSRIQVSD